MSSKKPLSQIKTGLFSRGAALAKVTLQVGAKAASAAVSQALSGSLDSGEIQTRALKLFQEQVLILTREVGELKGSLMKVGQMLSVVGENILPKEINDVLKTLQSDSPPLEWPAIEKQLIKQLGVERLMELEVENIPIASASMGQVHRAVRKSDGRVIALKVQYPGVDRAIDSDLNALKRIFSLTSFLPASHQFDEVFAEVRQMLHQEVNYERERELTDAYRKRFSDDQRFLVPATIPEFCTKRIMATDFVQGVRVDSPSVLELSQKRRNRLGELFLEHYFREIFIDQAVQTDPHLGNYLIQIDESGAENDRLILLDFGAVRHFSKAFTKPYFEMVRGSYLEDRESVIRGGMGIGFLNETDPEKVHDLFYELCLLVLEPFSDQVFHWKNSRELPGRVIKLGKELAMKQRLRPPPREVVFLDRKMVGVYSFLTVLGAEINARPLLKKYLFAEGGDV